MYCATKVPTSTTDYAERKNVHFVHALHRKGFPTWVTNAYDLAGTYNFDTDEGPHALNKSVQTINIRTFEIYIRNKLVC